MTPHDAARLLTGILGTVQAFTSVDTVNRYAKTQADKKRSSDGLFRSLALADLTALPARHSFVDGLSALIASASTGSLAEPATEQEGDWGLYIEIYAFTRSVLAASGCRACQMA